MPVVGMESARVATRGTRISSSGEEEMKVVLKALAADSLDTASGIQVKIGNNGCCAELRFERCK